MIGRAGRPGSHGRGRWYSGQPVFRRSRFVATVAVVAACGLVALTSLDAFARHEARAASVANSRPFLTAIDDWPSGDAVSDAAFGEHLRAAGAKFLRVTVRWDLVAPTGNVPATFNARDPGDPAYKWDFIDRWARVATSNGLTPFVSIFTAPDWAQGGKSTTGPARPSPAALADFATAAASRYSGTYAGLPRVRYWQVWNEPNLSGYLMPQTEAGRPVSPNWYRDMVNAAAQAVHAVHVDNVVVAGGLAPFGGNMNDPSGGPVPNQERIHPLQFMRQMLCMSNDAKQPKATCGDRTEFDVWAHHPYTYGGPTHSAFHPDDVSLGDLGEMRRLLEAAEAVGHIRSRQDVGFWVTEFSYDSRPADPKGLPPGLHARWVSEALYRMWQNGVSLVTWFFLRDRPFPAEMFQSGLYYRGESGIASDKPKPALRAFRFPFVAFRQRGEAISYWGRTPTSVKGAVVVEQQAGGRWRRLAAPSVNRYGLFTGRVVQARGRGPLRARLTNRSDASLPFSLTVPRDFRFCPWGSFC